MPKWLEELLTILLLLGVVWFVIARLPRVEIGHTDAFRRRRVFNWLAVGFTYAFLYFGRYNLNSAKLALGEQFGVKDFSFVFSVGVWVYGFSFLLNGPVTDRIGGKKAIMLGAGGAAAANLLMGLATYVEGFWTSHLVATYAVLYGLNMYFQSFGAVAIVKVNAAWFHVNERGVFGAIFGILISLGLYFAYDWGNLIVGVLPVEWVFFIPAALLGALFVVVGVRVKDTPGEAGHVDFDTADASSGDDGPRLGVAAVFKLMLSNPVIVTIAVIEFCSGYFRQGIMQYYRIFVKATGAETGYVYEHWGMMLCAAGILGGLFAGTISDRVFDSRRGPVAFVLYALMLGGSTILVFTYTGGLLGPMMVVMSLCVIGVHGMLSGTASMDFGGKKNAGVAVGIIDGFVYAGSGAMALLYAAILPDGDAAKDAGNWSLWPLSLVPVALVGTLLASRIWNAKPRPKTAAAH